MAEKNKQAEKTYTAQEVAVAVLKKAQELLAKHKLAKANTSHEIETGEEPNNDDAECPEFLADADIEDSGAHGEKKAKKGAPGMESADKDGDGDIDGDDAIEAEEEMSGQDLDGDGEAGEEPEHKEKIKMAAKPAPKADEDKKPKEMIDAASKDKPKEDKKPPFMKSEKACDPKIDLKKPKLEKSGTTPQKIRDSMAEVRGYKPATIPAPAKPTLKKFMLQRKMKKSGGMTADAQAGSKLSGASAPPPSADKAAGFKQQSPAAKVKNQDKMQVAKNKPVEKLLGISPKAPKKVGM